MTILGTVILQAPAEQITAHYGTLVGSILIRFGLNDLFHTPWFTAFLALLAGSLAMVAVRRQAWRVPMWGHLGCHIGVVVVLLGGTVGRLSGRKAFLELHEGSSASSVLATEGGIETGERIPLGFTLRLVDFDVDRYRAETRVVAYRIDGDAMRPVLSLDAARGSGWSKVGEDGTEVRVLGTKGAGAEIELRSGGSVSRRALGQGSKNAAWLPDGRTVLAVERRSAEAKAYRSRLSILEGGKTVCTKTIEVNDPLSWRGWHFYQSSFREEDPTWSGIQVVRDPGFPIVFGGFAMIGLGVLFIYYLRPWILRRRLSA
jgi:cytochrome c biogenesis protein ResB